MLVTWAPEAEETFDAIHGYILNNWGVKASANFIKKTKRILNSIALMPNIFPETEMENIRKAVIAPQSSLLYEVQENHILLLFFWDNRQEPLSF